MKKPMDCKETEHRIPLFLKKKLKISDVTRFVEHIKTCPSCKEELTIQFLSSEGIMHLEKGTSFHLEQELTEYINCALTARKTRIRQRIVMAAYEAAAILVIIGVYLYAGG